MKHLSIMGSFLPTRMRGSVAVLALLGASLPAHVLAETSTAIEPRDFATVCTHDPGANPPFFDVGAPHNVAVNCAARFNLVKGVGAGLYEPFMPLRRDQAATVVRNWLETAFGFTLPNAPEHPYTDLDGNVHTQGIALLADIGVLTGTSEDLFTPGRYVTRGQFATMMRRAISYADQLTIDGELPPDALVSFDDLADNPHAANMQAIAAIGVLTGFPDGTARPNAPLTRGQLATFLMRAAAYLHTFDRWEQSVVPFTFNETFTVTTVNDDEETVTAFTVPVRMVVYGFTGEIALRLNLSDRDTYHADEANEAITFGLLGLTLTRTDGSVVAVLASGEALNTATGVVDTVIAERAASVRFSVLARSFNDFQLRLAVTGQDPLTVTLRPPE